MVYGGSQRAARGGADAARAEGAGGAAGAGASEEALAGGAVEGGDTEASADEGGVGVGVSADEGGAGFGAACGPLVTGFGAVGGPIVTTLAMRRPASPMASTAPAPRKRYAVGERAGRAAAGSAADPDAASVVTPDEGWPGKGPGIGVTPD